MAHLTPKSRTGEYEAVQLSLAFEEAAPGAGTGRRAIETDFPILEISRLARIESYRKNMYRPAYYIHKWWARRTGATFRAILLGALLPEGYSPLDFLYKANHYQDVVVLDPFMGGGTTVGEALRLGARVIGVDINPVSWFLVKKIVEPVSLQDLDAAFGFLEQSAGREILRRYETTCPLCGSRAQSIYAYWVKTISCRNCGQPVPLRKTMVLAPHMSKPDTGLVTCPVCGHPYQSTTLGQSQRCPQCTTAFDPRLGFSAGAHYTCPTCSTRDHIMAAVQQGEAPPSHAMVAILIHCPTCGKGYKKPDGDDLARTERIRKNFEENREQLLYPRTAIPPGFNTNQMRNYNYHFWFQMFNERQLLGLSQLLQAILCLEDPNVMEFMLLLFSGTLEFNNLFCSPKGLGTGAVRPLFAHHAFIPAKEPIETNLWGVNNSSGGFSTFYRERLRRGTAYARHPVERRLDGKRATKVPIPGESLKSAMAVCFAQLATLRDRRVLLLNRSSTDLADIPDGGVDLVITDPPYLDNVMYSELSDFFYVWLRLGLKDRYPQWERESTVQDNEAIKNLEHGKDAAFYQSVLTAVFRECHRVLKDEGLLIFTFHHGAAAAWNALAKALRDAGFAVLCLWPVHAEMDVGVPILGKEGVRFDAILACRKWRAESVEIIPDRAMLVRRIEEALESVVKMLGKEFDLTNSDRLSLLQGVAAMFFTQRQTDLLPSVLSLGSEGSNP